VSEHGGIFSVHFRRSAEFAGSVLWFIMAQMSVQVSGAPVTTSMPITAIACVARNLTAFSAEAT
jgi:hypothetical protein